MKIYPSHEQPFTYVINDEDLIIQVNSESWNGFSKRSANSFQGSFSHSIVGESLWSFIKDQNIQKLYHKIIQSVRTSQRVLQIPFYCNTPRKKTYLKLTLSPLKHEYIQIKSEMVCFEYHDGIDVWDMKYPSYDAGKCSCNMSQAIKHENIDWMDHKEYIDLITMANEYEIPRIFHGLSDDSKDTIVSVKKDQGVSYLNQ